MSQQREYRIPIVGVILLFLGVLFLLQTLNILPWGLWSTLWRFWPVLIIILGLNILLRRYNPWLIAGLFLVLLLASLGLAIWQYQTPKQTTTSYNQPLGSLERAQVQIDFNAGNLKLSSLSYTSTYLVEASSEVQAQGSGLRTEFRTQGNEGILCLSTEGVDRKFWEPGSLRWNVKLTPNIPLTIAVKAAASNVDFDLSDLKVTSISMNVDAGNFMVRMPASAGVTSGYIKAAVANIEVSIPSGVALKLKTRADLSGVNINESRFPRSGDYYQSPDFETARNRLELEIDADLGRVSVE